MVNKFKVKAIFCILLLTLVNCSNGSNQSVNKENNMEDVFASFEENNIEFISMRPRGGETIVLDRQVRVTAPQEFVELAENGSFDLLEGLISCLKNKDRAWTAAVLLSSMTGRNGKTMELYAATPGDWLKTHGETAHDDWNDWYEKEKDNLVWDDETDLFVRKD